MSTKTPTFFIGKASPHDDSTFIALLTQVDYMNEEQLRQLQCRIDIVRCLRETLDAPPPRRFSIPL